MALLDALIDVDWAAANIDRSDVKFLDGTWSMPGEVSPLPGIYIPGAQFFDVDVIADLSSDMKHMLPSIATLEAALSDMGIQNTDHIIVYDRHGFRAAPRLWWTLRMFGHDKVSIINGGLPAWMAAGHKTSIGPAQFARSKYKARKPVAKVANQAQIISAIGSDTQILDARSTGRFHGTEPEPRAGLRSGHIPGSLNLPFGKICEPETHLRDLPTLVALVGASGIDLSKPIITTCGSGITAAGLAFVLYLLGAQDVSVYDGSWTEWGASDAPIEL